MLIDVWTYTCINWLRTLPYVRAWAGKYKDQGLVVIGVHSPEFAFEHNVDNVRRQAKDMRVDYPIALDNDFAIWRALNNNYWPALYVVDAQGRIRYHQFGEGEYEKRKESYDSCCPKRVQLPWGRSLLQSMPAARKSPPIGTASNRRKTTSARSAQRILRLPAAPYWTSLKRMLRQHDCDSTSGP